MPEGQKIYQYELPKYIMKLKTCVCKTCNLVGRDNQFYGFGFKLSKNITGTQRINPCELSMFRFCLIKFPKYFNALDLIHRFQKVNNLNNKLRPFQKKAFTYFHRLRCRILPSQLGD